MVLVYVKENYSIPVSLKLKKKKEKRSLNTTSAILSDLPPLGKWRRRRVQSFYRAG
jgi:hypothetical protein